MTGGIIGDVEIFDEFEADELLLFGVTEVVALMTQDRREVASEATFPSEVLWQSETVEKTVNRIRLDRLLGVRWHAGLAIAAVVAAAVAPLFFCSLLLQTREQPFEKYLSICFPPPPPSSRSSRSARRPSVASESPSIGRSRCRIEAPLVEIGGGWRCRRRTPSVNQKLERRIRRRSELAAASKGIVSGLLRCCCYHDEFKYL